VRSTGHATQSQEAFLDGHVTAFEALGGVPVTHIRYDNLKAAVSRVLCGRTRVENGRWVAFRSHYDYGFDAFYCQPGRDGAHEKGGVEGEGGRFRRTLLTISSHPPGADAAGDDAGRAERPDRRLRRRQMPRPTARMPTSAGCCSP
jgi:hypothetical protein